MQCGAVLCLLLSLQVSAKRVVQTEVSDELNMGSTEVLTDNITNTKSAGATEDEIMEEDEIIEDQAQKGEDAQEEEQGGAPVVTPENAEQILKEENDKCEAKYWFGGSCHEGPSNPFKESVHMCGPSGRRVGDSCVVTQEWMLLGDKSKDVAWWAELQLHVVDAMLDHLEEKCIGNKAETWDWATGKCKRHSDVMMYAFGVLSKVTNGKAGQPVPDEKMTKIKSELAKTKARLMAHMDSGDDTDVKKHPFFRRLTKLISSQPKSFLKKHKTQINGCFKAALKRDGDKAEELLVDLEKKAAEHEEDDSSPEEDTEDEVAEVANDIEEAMHKGEEEVKALSDKVENPGALSLAEMREVYAATRDTQVFIPGMISAVGSGIAGGASWVGSGIAGMAGGAWGLAGGAWAGLMSLTFAQVAPVILVIIIIFAIVSYMSQGNENESGL